jgi:hypothetical protein
MKKNLLILFGVCIAFFSLAQPPQSNSVSNGNLFNNQGATTLVLDSVQLQRMDKDQIPAADDVEELHESEVRQQNNFKKEADVYKSSKALIKSNSSSRSASAAEEMQLQQSVTKLKGLAQTPSEQIEANILYYDQGNYNADRAPQLMEALRLNPNHPEGLNLLVANSLVTGDTTKVLSALQKFKALNYMPESMTCYARDLVNSVPTNTTLITHGALDTYSAIQQQFALPSTSIDIISLDLLQSPQYRTLLTAKGYGIPEQTTVDVSYLVQLMEKNPSRKFAFSMTIPSAYLVQFEQELVPNGLVFLYPNHWSNEQILQANEQFLDSFSYMDCGVELDESIAALKQNYMPMILTVETLSTDKSKEKRSLIERKKIKIKQKK